MYKRQILGSVALALSAATYVYTAGNAFTLIGVTAWLLSIALWMIVAAERSPDQLVADWVARLTSFKGPALMAPKPRLVPLAAFILVLGVAIFFRSYRLDTIPNEMTSDHVEKLLDANDVAHGIFHVFFTRNAGREAFQFYFLPIVAAIFGTGMSFLTLKIASVIEGVALVPLMIWFGREVVDRETGLFAAGLLAISWWHTLLARLGLRIALTPLVFTLVLIALVRAIRTGSRRSWLWAGVWMGIGVYCYQALRLTPLVAIAAFAVSVTPPLTRALIAQWKGRADAPLAQLVAENIVSRQGLNLLAAGLIALAIFVPMLRVWHDFPADLWNRVINRTTNHEVAIEGSPVGVLADNYVKALGMFNVKGDASWFSAVPGTPVLDLITGSLFFLGVAGWLVRLRARHDPVDAFLLVAGLIMLLPSALSIAFPIENPSTTRASATIPVVFLIAAWPVALIRQRWTAVMGRTVGLALSCLLVGALVGGATAFNYQTYFVRYADSYRHSALNPSEVAVAVRDIIGPDAPLDGVWLQGWPFWHDYRAIGIEAGDITFDNAIVDVPALTSYLSDLPGEFAIRPLVFILHPQDREALRVLREHFPNGEPVYRHSQIEGRDFILFVVR